MLECKACGYKKGYEYNEDGDWVEVNPKGEEFIKINGHYTVERYDHTHQVYLVACPECRTVKMDY